MIPNAETKSAENKIVQSDAPSNRTAMMIVFFIVVIDLLGFSIVLPLLPIAGKDYLEPLFPGKEGELWVGGITGLLMASFSAMQFFAAPGWGRFSDRVGRRPTLLIGLFASVLFYLLFGYAAGLPLPESSMLAVILMFVARIGAGVAGANISTAQAVIADCTPPEKRKHGMALIGAAFGVAFTFGPLLGALAMKLAPNIRVATAWTGFIASALSGIAFVLAIILLPETRNLEASATLRRRIIDFNAWKWALTTSALAPVILVFFLVTVGFGSLETTLSLLLEYLFDMKSGDSKDQLYWFFAYTGFMLVLTQGFIYRRLARRLSEVSLMTVGIALMSLGLIVLGAVTFAKSVSPTHSSTQLPGLLVALGVAVIGFGFLTPSAQALVSRRAPQNRQGEILGVNQSAAALGRILGPIFGISLFTATKTHMLPYIFGTGLLVLMLPLIPRIRRE